MAFTYTLTNAAVTGTDPAGTDLISLGDDNIRTFKSAVIERINSRFVDANTDPWIIKSPTAGSGNTQAIIPTADNTYTLGEAARRWSDIRAVLATIGTVTGNLTGTVLTAAQTNITSVGTLVSLTVTGLLVSNGGFSGTTGTFTSGIGIGGLAAVVGWFLAPNTKGLLIQNNVGGNKVAITLDAANVWQFGDGLASNFNSTVTATGFTGNLTGTILTASQPNITQVGTLSNLSVSNNVITTGGSSNAGSMWKSGVSGLVLQGAVGGTNDFIIVSPAATTIMSVPTGTLNPVFAGGITVANASAIGGVGNGFTIGSNGGVNRIQWNATQFEFVSSANVLTNVAAANFIGNLTGTILTAAQTNITSLGTLTSLNISGTLAVTQINPFSLGTFKMLGGSVAMSHRNNADTADNLLITDAGAVTIRSTLGVGGNITMTGGTLVGVPKNTLGNQLGAQTTLAKISTVGAVVVNAAQQGWGKFIGDDAVTYYVPLFT